MRSSVCINSTWFQSNNKRFRIKTFEALEEVLPPRDRNDFIYNNKRVLPETDPVQRLWDIYCKYGANIDPESEISERRRFIKYPTLVAIHDKNLMKSYDKSLTKCVVGGAWVDVNKIRTGLLHIVVEKQYRGLGIGSELLKETEKYFKGHIHKLKCEWREQGGCNQKEFFTRNGWSVTEENRATKYL